MVAVKFFFQFATIEMGKCFGAGKTTDIHEGPNLELLQEGEKVRNGPVGVTDGKKF